MKIYFIVVNILSLLLYGVDKIKAIFKRRRIPEKFLLFFGFVGGFVGGIIGMILFRHKIRKPTFMIVNLLSLLLYFYCFIRFGD